MQVGTKELKNNLSRYLRQVRVGEVVRVTDHGKVIAELRPVADDARSDDAALQAMEAEGSISVGARRPKDFTPVRAKSAHRASDIVIEDRR